MQPGETFAYTCELEIYQPSPFEAAMILNLHDRGIRQVSLTVRGRGVAPEGTSDATSKQSPP